MTQAPLQLSNGFTTVLIANRGEIAVRIIRTLRELGITSVAVYSDPDATARHVIEADFAVRIGAAPARESYLDGAAIIAAAQQTGAQAIHPGYGFLAENAEFAAACTEAGLVFIGPPAAAIEAMGDKIRAKQIMIASGVPVVPGRNDPSMTDAELATAAADVGYPVLVKPSAGGGGKGMQLVADPSELPAALATARRVAASAFGDDTLFVERFIPQPRHIEIQILADAHGRVIHLGERECSLQRRHQKVVEEAPSPMLTNEDRARMGSAAVAAAAAVGYVGAGTVEFIVSASDPTSFFFLEMNTRLQVEHPVTEMVTGIDLVAWQLRIAAGDELTIKQGEVVLRGHAIEARVYAEDPGHGFLPTGGQVLQWSEPDGHGVRVDSGILTGTVVGNAYDPMLAKVIAWGDDRATALGRLTGALRGTTLIGLGTNLAFLQRLLADPDVVAGNLRTDLIEQRLDDLVVDELPDHVWVAATLATGLVSPVDVGSWQRVDGWRVGEPASERVDLTIDGQPLAGARLRRLSSESTSAADPQSAEVCLPGGSSATATSLAFGSTILVGWKGESRLYAVARSGATTWLSHRGRSWSVVRTPAARAAAAAGGATSGGIVSPMPGTIVAVFVEPGQRVTAGSRLLTVEAMKMEHTLTAPFDGEIAELNATVGASVALGQSLLTVHPAEEAS